MKTPTLHRQDRWRFFIVFRAHTPGKRLRVVLAPVYVFFIMHPLSKRDILPVQKSKLFSGCFVNLSYQNNMRTPIIIFTLFLAFFLPVAAFSQTTSQTIHVAINISGGSAAYLSLLRNDSSYSTISLRLPLAPASPCLSTRHSPTA